MTAQEMFEQLGGYMNEYQEALNSLRVLSGCEASAKVIQKLIDRATPISTSKIIDANGEPTAPRGIVLCISCRQCVHESDAFCRCCGQALRSEEDENTL